MNLLKVRTSTSAHQRLAHAQCPDLLERAHAATSVQALLALAQEVDG